MKPLFVHLGNCYLALGAIAAVYLQANGAAQVRLVGMTDTDASLVLLPADAQSLRAVLDLAAIRAPGAESTL